MSEQAPINETIRDEETINDVINDAILEVVDLFANEMSERDKHILLGVTKEKSTPPIGRVMYLRQIVTSVGVSASLLTYINQVLQTLRQNLTPGEQNRFRGFDVQKNLLHDM